MKKYLLILSMIFGVIFLADAQKMPTAVEIATKNIEALTKKVKLNPTQRNIIYNYMLDFSREQVAFAKKQQSGMFNQDDMAKLYKLQNENNDNIRNILKGEQLAEFDKYLEEQLRGGDKKKKKKGKQAKEEEEEVVTGISGLKLPS
jgi:protein CpxP